MDCGLFLSGKPRAFGGSFTIESPPHASIRCLYSADCGNSLARGRKAPPGARGIWAMIFFKPLYLVRFRQVDRRSKAGHSLRYWRTWSIDGGSRRYRGESLKKHLSLTHQPLYGTRLRLFAPTISLLDTGWILDRNRDIKLKGQLADLSSFPDSLSVTLRAISSY